MYIFTNMYVSIYCMYILHYFKENMEFGQLFYKGYKCIHLQIPTGSLGQGLTSVWDEWLTLGTSIILVTFIRKTELTATLFKIIFLVGLFLQNVSYFLDNILISFTHLLFKPSVTTFVACIQVKQNAPVSRCYYSYTDRYLMKGTFIHHHS